MIDINSNCSRVDAVKSRATQLRMQLDQLPRSQPADPAAQKAQSQVQSVDVAVKKDDAQKAETALTTAAGAVQQAQADSQNQSTIWRGLNVYV
jgi:hypothetical protein